MCMFSLEKKRSPGQQHRFHPVKLHFCMYPKRKLLGRAPQLHKAQRALSGESFLGRRFSPTTDICCIVERANWLIASRLGRSNHASNVMNNAVFSPWKNHPGPDLITCLL